MNFEYSKLDERGSKWLYLTSREFERVFGYKNSNYTAVHLTMESDEKPDSETQGFRKAVTLNRMEEVWAALKKLKDIRDIAIPFRIVFYKEKWFYNKKE